MAFDLADLTACLALSPGQHGSVRGHNLDLDYHRVFGGQILGQTVMALSRVAEGKSLRSFTQQFPREGNTEHPIDYDCRVVHAGRTFATATATARQGDRVVGTTLASLHASEGGAVSQEGAPSVGGPQDATPIELGMVPWEVRAVAGGDLATRESRPARFGFWMRCPEAAGDEWLHRALLAHATDLTVIGTVLLPVEGVCQEDNGTTITTAVTAHSLSFHGEVSLDDWLLVDQRGVSLSGGRGYGRGDVWTADGRLVASFAQESLIRLAN